MNKKLFHRNSAGKSSHLMHGIRANKLSMGDLSPFFSRPPSEAKKRNSNDHFEYSKVQRLTYKKHKMNSTMSASNSVMVTKTNSPCKLAGRNTQAVLEQKTKLKLYKFYYQIGFGGFGRVWKVCHKQTMKDLAMKQISKKKVIQKNNVESVLNQRKILSLLSHPFLINMKCAFQDHSNLYLVMDYLRGGDLRYHICYKEGFSQKQIKFITGCLLIGLQYVHSMGVIHKDLKPENIVFEESGYVRITDFGIATKYSATQNQISAKSQSSGTPVYMAPQILFKKQYSYESDFYALGVIIYELCLGKRPYEGKNRAQIKQQIARKDILLKEADLPYGWSSSLADLINKLLKKSSCERLGHKGIHEIKEHRFFADMKWSRLQKKQLKPPFIPSVISEMKSYLDEIALFNDINQQNNKQNSSAISKQMNSQFAEYDYEKKKPAKLLKNNLRKGKRQSQKKLIA